MATLSEIRQSTISSAQRLIFIECDPTTAKGTFNLACIRGDSSSISSDTQTEEISDVTSKSASEDVVGYSLSTDVTQPYLSLDPVSKMIEKFIFTQATAAECNRRVLVVKLGDDFDSIAEAYISDASLAANGLQNEAQSVSKVEYTISYGEMTEVPIAKLTLGDGIVTYNEN